MGYAELFEQSKLRPAALRDHSASSSESEGEEAEPRAPPAPAQAPAPAPAPAAAPRRVWKGKGAFAPRRRPPPAAARRYTVGEAARRHGEGCVKGSRLSLVGELISEIADVPAFAAGCATVFLSNNALTSLRGVSQFRDVVALSATNNCVAHLEELAHLGALKKLETLALDGNAVSWLPGYRCRAICAAGDELKRLDGRDVSPAERAAARPGDRKNGAIWDDLVRRALWARAIGIYAKLRVCHRELRRVFASAFSAPRAEPRPPAATPRELLKRWRLDGTCAHEAPHVRRRVEDAAREAAFAMKRGGKQRPAGDDVFARVLDGINRQYMSALEACEHNDGAEHRDRSRLPVRALCDAARTEMAAALSLIHI
mgnify:CR=1 FL=1